MNDKIKLLAEQARFKFECHTCGESPYDMKKFAELIVRECMNQCEDMDDQYRIGIYFEV